MNFNVNDEKDVFIMKLINYFITKSYGNSQLLKLSGIEQKGWSARRGN